jgi:hypothetical protein
MYFSGCIGEYLDLVSVHEISSMYQEKEIILAIYEE